MEEARGNRYIYLCAIFAQLMCLLLGYHLGVISGAMLILQDTFDLDIVWQQLIATATIVGGAVGLFPSGVLVDLLGRKKTILISNVITTVGSILTAAAPGKEVIFVGRFLTGTGTGIASMAVPVYVSECAPVNIRGRLGGLTPVMINGGVFLSAVIGGAFNGVHAGWRYVFATPCVVGLVQFLGFIFAPESPRWLMDKGRNGEARSVLVRLRNSPEAVLSEMEDIQRAITEAKKSQSEESMALVRVFRSPPVRRALVLGVCLAMIFQITGVAALLIIKMAGFVSREAAWLATIPFAVQFLAAFVNMCLVERTGRKILFVGAHIGMLIALIVLGLGFYLSAVHSPAINHHITETYSNGTNITDCQFRSCHECISAVSVQCGFCYDVVDHGSCLPVSQNGSALGGRCSQESSLSISHFKLDKDFCPTQYSWVPILGLSLYLLSFGSGAGTIWIIIAEIFPLWARSTCSPIAIVTIWIFQTIASMTFLSMAEVIGVHGIFWLYAGCCLMAVIYTFIYLPETRGTSLEDVEKLFMSQSERSEL